MNIFNIEVPLWFCMPAFAAMGVMGYLAGGAGWLPLP